MEKNWVANCPRNSKWVLSVDTLTDNSNLHASSSKSETVQRKDVINHMLFRNQNLAYQMQPKTIHNFIGQNHVLAPNTYLYELLKNHEIPSMILWGPPGCGKSSLANIIKEICFCSAQKYNFKQITCLNDLKFPTDRNKQLVVYLDGVQTFNRASQRFLVSHIKNGNVILIASTTENPSFLLISELLEYCKIVVMDKLRKEDLVKIIWKTLSFLNIDLIDDLNTIRNYCVAKNNRLCIQKSSVEWLAATCDGDARIALNNLEFILQNHDRNKKVLDMKNIKNEIKKKHLVYDQNGEEHHNIISAMHESIKGYNDNAALYWTTRMLVGGEDPLFIARRLVRAASEDTGTSDVHALKLAVSTMLACKNLDKYDTPDILLTQCAIYLARAPTDKTVSVGLELAKKLIKETNKNQPQVPRHLGNTRSKLEELFQYDKKSYMPIGLEDVNFL